MKKLLIIFLIFLQFNSNAQSNIVFEHYNNQSFPPGYTDADFSVCGSMVKNFKLYYTYCVGPVGCAPSNSCPVNSNYRFLVTLQQNGNWVADHTFQASSQWTYDYFTGITVTPGSYRVKVVFQKSNVICNWIDVGTTYSDPIVVSAIPPAPTLSISGPANPCHTSGYTYTVNGNTTGTGNYTWTSTNADFRINGQPFPLTTTSNSAVINSNVAGSSTTIGVTLSGVTTVYCGQFNTPTKSLTSISTILTAGAPDCIAPKTFVNFSAQPSGTTGYLWQTSPDQVNWTNMTQTTSSFSYSFQTPGTYHFRVRRSLFGCTSNWAYFTVHVITSGLGCRTAQDELANEGKNHDGTTIFPNPSIGNFYLNTTDFNDPVNIVVYDVFGKKVDERLNIPTYQNSEAINFGGNLKSGIYTVEIYNGTKRIVKRIVKAE